MGEGVDMSAAQALRKDGAEPLAHQGLALPTEEAFGGGVQEDDAVLVIGGHHRVAQPVQDELAVEGREVRLLALIVPFPEDRDFGACESTSRPRHCLWAFWPSPFRQENLFCLCRLYRT